MQQLKTGWVLTGTRFTTAMSSASSCMASCSSASFRPRALPQRCGHSVFQGCFLHNPGSRQGGEGAKAAVASSSQGGEGDGAAVASSSQGGEGGEAAVASSSLAYSSRCEHKRQHISEMQWLPKLIIVRRAIGQASGEKPLACVLASIVLLHANCHCWAGFWQYQYVPAN